MAGTVVICFTDLVASTELMTQLGDEEMDALRRRHFDILERQSDAHGGEVVKNVGDGLMISFGSASDAVAAGVAMQRAVDAASRAGARDAAVMRVGISAGDATPENGDWFGVPVVEGARLCAAAAPGQVLVSEVVRLLAGSRGGHEFRSVGTLELKGLPDPVGAAEVMWTPAAVALAVPLPGALAPDEGEWAFAGRDAAFAQLQSEWKAAVAGEPRIVMIAGEPGIGKTRLVAELARAVHDDGALVLLGRTDEHVDAPYGPWREALRALVRSVPDEVLESHVADHGGELTRIVPDLARRIEGATASVAPDPETERLLLFEAVNGLLDVMSAEAPVLLVLDDLHWADRSSLQLLLHVLRADTRAALLVVATYRDTDVDRAHPLAGTLADLRRERGASRIALAGLDRDGVAALMERQGGHELDEPARAFATTLRRETEGNPFFLREVLLHLAETGGLVQTDGRWHASATLDEAGLPEGVREVIGRRLAGLPEPTNNVLGVASVIGREFDVGLVAEVGTLTVDEVLDALAPAEQARLIGEVPTRPGRYSFSHALVRTVLVDELGTNRRVRLHRAAGLALETQSHPDLGELAFHFGEAAVMGETERAVRYAAAAAEHALELAASDDAAAYARRALRALELGDGDTSARLDVLLLLGRALNASGAGIESRDATADAFVLAVEAGDLERACAAAIAYGTVSTFGLAGDSRGPAQLETVLGLLPPGDSQPRALAMARLGQWQITEPGDTGARTARAAYEMAVRVDSKEARQLAASAVAATSRSIDPAAVLRFSEEARDLAAEASVSVSLDSYITVAEARVVLGDVDGADRTMADLRAAFGASPLRGLAGYRDWVQTITDGWEMVRAIIAGDLAAVETIAAGARSLPAESFGAFTAAVGEMQVAYMQGDWMQAAALWADACVLLPGGTEPYFGYSGASGDLDPLRAYWQEWAARIPLRPAWTRPANTGVLAESLRRLGERDASAALASEYAGYSGAFFTNGLSWFYGPFDTALGIAHATAGDLDSSITHLTRAVEQCDAIASPTWGAIARLELATAARVRGALGDSALADEVSAVARRAMTECGMPGWLIRLDRLDAGDLEPWKYVREPSSS